MLIMHKIAGKPPIKREIDESNKLAELQGLVGGYVEQVYLDKGVVALVNEEGRLMHLTPNIVSCMGVLCGNIAFCSIGNNDWGGLTSEQIRFVEQYCKDLSI